MEHSGPPAASTHPLYDRLLTVVALTTIGLILTLAIDPPASWGLLVLLLVTVVLGADYTLRIGPDGRSRRSYDTTTLWILPGLLTLGAFLFLRLPVFASGPTIGAGIFATGALLAGTLLAENYVIAPSDETRTKARFWLNILSYLIAFALFTAIYAPKDSVPFSAIAVAVVTALVCLELYLGSRSARHRAIIYASLTGLSLGQITWALNYWNIDAITGGALLTIAFYLISSVLRYDLSGRLDQRTLFEFSVVSGIWLAIIFFTGLWLR